MNNKTLYTSVAIVVALALVISPLVIGADALACKHKNKDKHHGKHNEASQGIGQSQSSSQNSQVVSGGDTIASGNNLSFQGQENRGNNALGQQ